MEQFEHLEPNFKRLRQQHLDGELRKSVNYIQREISHQAIQQNCF